VQSSNPVFAENIGHNVQPIWLTNFISKYQQLDANRLTLLYDIYHERIIFQHGKIIIN